MAWCPRTTTGTVMLWFSLVGIVGLAASIAYNSLILNQDYATTPADSWLLVGGVTSTSAQFRIRLAAAASNNDNTINYKLILSKNNNDSTNSTEDEDDEDNVEITLTAADHQTGHAVMETYGLYSVEVDDLEPLTHYPYWVTASTFSSQAPLLLKGTFSTPPTEGTPFNFSVAAASCAWTGSQSAVFDTIRQDHPDLQLFVHLGDFHYQDLHTDDIVERLDAIGTVLNSPPQAQLYRSQALAYTWDDHDYLGNQEPGVTYSQNVRDTALLSYPMAFPHYPLTASSSDSSSNNNYTLEPTPIYQAFTIGTVRFIMTDLQSESDGTTSIYSTQQQEWLFDELTQADQYDFVVWITSKPWIGMASDSDNNTDFYGSWIADEYQKDRSDLSSLISNVIGADDGPQNLLVVGGDAHMVAFDDGTHTYFGDEMMYENNTVNSFPILQSAPLDRLGSVKGGPYTEGCYAVDLERTNQYSIISFQFPDDASSSSNATACIEIDSYQVDQWYNSKQRLFSKHLCGKLFRPAMSQDQIESYTCQIAKLTPVSTGMFVVGVVLCAVLGFATCIVSMRDPTKGDIQQVGCGLLGILIAWSFTALTVSAAVFVPYLSGIEQYDIRVSYAIAIVMILAMFLIMFIIACCCARKKPSTEKQNSTRFASQKRASAAPPAPTMTLPYVVRRETNSVASEEELPESVIVTGGKKLHEEGLVGKGVRVAVIDSGIDKDHPGFKGQVKKQTWHRSGTPLATDDHGTHVAGTIHLMAPQAEIYDYRVFGSQGSLSVDQAITKAIREAADAGCSVINMSLGGPLPNNEIWEAIQYASKKGVVLVCAAGNEGDNNPLTNEISFPASYKECISVAAVAKANGFPVALFSNSNNMVDYAGIGVDVISFKPGGGYQTMSGTSMACPHVAGLIACLLSNESNTASNIRQVLDGLAIDIDAIGIDNATGVGFVTYLDESAFDELLPRTVKIEESSGADAASESVELSPRLS